jgi:hypothetical protein
MMFVSPVTSGMSVFAHNNNKATGAFNAVPSVPQNMASGLESIPKASSVAFGNRALLASLPRPHALLRQFDFHTVGDSILTQSKFIYGALLTSRAVFARTKNERLEVLRRDPFGWYCWFYGKPLLEWAVIHAYTAGDPKLRAIMKNPFPGLMAPFNPPSRVFQTTQGQLKERLEQIRRGMEKAGVNGRRLAQVENTFARAQNLLGVTSFIGLVFTIVSLGIGVNLLNITLTRANVRRQRLEAARQAQNSLSTSPASALS